MHRWKPLQKAVREITCDSHTLLPKIHGALAVSNAEIMQVGKKWHKDLTKCGQLLFEGPSQTKWSNIFSSHCGRLLKKKKITNKNIKQIIER